MSASFSDWLRRRLRRPAEPDRLAAYAWMRLGAPPVALPPSAFTVTEPIATVSA